MLTKPAANRHFFTTRGWKSLLELQISIHQIVLLEAAEPLADLPGPDGPDPRDRLEVPLGGPQDRVEPFQVRHHLSDHLLRQARDVREDAEAPWRHGAVERVDVPRVPEELGDSLCLEQLPVAQRVE